MFYYVTFHLETVTTNITSVTVTGCDWFCLVVTGCDWLGLVVAGPYFVSVVTLAREQP